MLRLLEEPSVWPASAACQDGPSPENGDDVQLDLAAASWNMCMANQSSPGADETPTESLPGCSLAALAKSAIVLYGLSARTTKNAGIRHHVGHQEEIGDLILGLAHDGIDRDLRRAGDHDRVAVRLGLASSVRAMSLPAPGL